MHLVFKAVIHRSWLRFGYFLLGCFLCLGLGYFFQLPSSAQPNQPGAYAKTQAMDLNALKESGWMPEFEQYLQRPLTSQPYSERSLQQKLAQIYRLTGSRAALLHLTLNQGKYQLLVSSVAGKPVILSQPNVSVREMMEVINDFRLAVADPRHQFTNAYLGSAQQIYDWWIRPLEKKLQAEKIDTLMFCVGAGMRSLPWAALHDGNQFLAEKFNISLVPGFELTDTSYKSLKNSRVLAMGASEFRDFAPLPNVPNELKAIQDLWGGSTYLNAAFTPETLRQQRQQEPYAIVHLATHAMFQPGLVSNSFIQMWDQNVIRLNQLPTLDLGSPPVELLVLSACQTALGDRNAELGFAGLALQSGAKSALGSLWQVSDAATYQLMQNFYTALRDSSYKAQALGTAQKMMLKIPEFQAPYYWAGFTLIGSPW